MHNKDFTTARIQQQQVIEMPAKYRNTENLKTATVLKNDIRV